ncbi:MAG: DUF3089 domain-containing protein [Paludibacteraceae bacterium]|nr:DUF3089 domain-containing protein [Paludibacteraceae bacterium]
MQWLFFFTAFTYISCSRNEDITEYIPSAPDYNDSTMWYIEDNDTDGNGADIFYVVSTWEIDWYHDSMICHYADVWNADHRAHMTIEMSGVADYMKEGNRFYSPYYRHTTIDGWVTQNEDTILRRTRLSMNDVCTAFDYFIQHRDNTRPLVIAGFSQGGMAMIELLKHMDDSTYNHLAAAYIMGYKITPQDTLCPHIKPAKGETDTGVAICFNTVKDVKYLIPVISETCAGINPVNWHTDATPAILDDTVTVSLDTLHHLVVVKGYSGSEYKPYKDFINQGDIHSCEPWLYKEHIRKNINTRVREMTKDRFAERQKTADTERQKTAEAEGQKTAEAERS